MSDFLRRFWPWAALAVAMAVLQALPETWHNLLRYDRAALINGELWRLLTSNFIHLGWEHLALNVAGLLVLGWLFAGDDSLRNWVLVFVVTSLTSTIGLFFLTPEIGWCVGLSGTLHGVFFHGALRWVQLGDSFGKWLLIGAAAKLGWEQVGGAVPLSESIVQGNVVTDAHLWGAIGGMLTALIPYIWRRFNARV